jgi:hypothetical protein
MRVGSYKRVELSHLSGKNKDAAKVGHPAIVATPRGIGLQKNSLRR